MKSAPVAEGNKKPNSKSDTVKGGLIVLAILFVLILVTGGKAASSKTSLPTTPPVELQIDSKNPDTASLTSQIEKFFKDDNLGTPSLIEITNYEGGGYGVYINYIGSTTDMKLVKYQMATAYIDLHKTGKNIKAVSLFNYAQTQDKFGNRGTSPFFKTLISAEDWSKINWSADEANLTQDTLPGIWSVTQDYSSKIH
jgi:hypothetical protein